MPKLSVVDANIAKLAVINALVNEGYLTKEKVIDFLDKYVLIITEKSWFERQYQRFFPHRKSGSQYYDVVKIVSSNTSYEEGENEDEDTIAQLQFELIQAEKDENFELAEKLKKQIEILKRKK